MDIRKQKEGACGLHEAMETTIKTTLLDMVWHNLPKVSALYKGTLNIDFGDISIPHKAVSARHDLVHRNGRTKADGEIQIDEAIVDTAIKDVRNFIKSIDEQMKTLASPTRIGDVSGHRDKQVCVGPVAGG